MDNLSDSVEGVSSRATRVLLNLDIRGNDHNILNFGGPNGNLLIHSGKRWRRVKVQGSNPPESQRHLVVADIMDEDRLSERMLLMENTGQPPVTGPCEEVKAEHQPLKSSTRVEQ